MGKLLPIQLIYTGAVPCSLPESDLPVPFSVAFTKNHWSNADKLSSILMKSYFHIYSR